MKSSKISIKSLSQVITEGKEQDEDPKAIHIASEIDLIDKAEKNISSSGEKRDTKKLDKKRKELVDQYKEITGHDKTEKSIPESLNEAVSVYEGILEDLGIKDFKEFGRKYVKQIKKLVAEIGGSYVGYTYDPPTKTVAIVTDKGIGKYYFDPESGNFESYQVQTFLK